MVLMMLSALALGTVGAEPTNTPPAGFRSLFNGKDLTGWYGLNPHNVVKLKDDKLKAALAKQRAEFSHFWKVESGDLVNGGEGPYATTDEEFGDIELLIDYKTVAKALLIPASHQPGACG